jgi:uncharacterized membrane protein YeaQ/YmgE (transglycosylase-associated protein family)
MDATLAAAAALIGAPNAQFLALLFIGSSIGWCATKLARVDIRTGALLLAGVTGAWLAAELAVRAGLGQRCADAVLIAGGFGAALFCIAWGARRYVNGPTAHIAVRH